MTSKKLLGPDGEPIDNSDQAPFDPAEGIAMENIRSGVWAVSQQFTERPGVAINAIATALAQMTAQVCMLPAERTPERIDEVAQEAFRRIFDACSSIEDLLARKAPWRVQSTKLKAAEAAGARVRDMGEAVKRSIN